MLSSGAKKNKICYGGKFLKALCSIRKQSIKGSITLEASLVLPIFMFVLICLSFLIEAVRIQEHIGVAINEVSVEISQYSYGKKELLNLFNKSNNHEVNNIISNTDNIIKQVINNTYAKKRIVELSGENIVNNSIIVGGKDGIILLGSVVDNKDRWINIIVDYKLRLPFQIVSLPDIHITQKGSSREWIGYYSDKDNTSDEDDRIVYTVPMGSVYHMNKSCTYIKVESVGISRNALINARNVNGGKYYPCSICHPTKASGSVVYITKYGTTFHRTKACSEINRNIIERRLSEVKDIMPCCKKCGGTR